MQQKSLTIRPACVQKYCFAISPSAFEVSTPWQVLWAGRTAGVFQCISVDVMQFKFHNFMSSVDVMQFAFHTFSAVN